MNKEINFKTHLNHSIGLKKEKEMSDQLSRRSFLKCAAVSMAAVAGTGMGATAANQQCGENSCQYPVNPWSTRRYSYPDSLKKFTPDMQPDLADDEMRITFLGTASPPGRLAQHMMSVFVEVGPWL